MIKEALEFLARIQTPKNPQTIEVRGEPHEVGADGTLGEYVAKRAPQWTKPTFPVSTLSGLADLVKAKVDDFPDEICLHVVDHLSVELVSTRADEYARRHVYARATHVEGTGFQFNKFLEAEDFLISFRRSFLFNEDAVKVQQLCSQLESGMQVNLADDGMSQKLEVKQGTTNR